MQNLSDPVLTAVASPGNPSHVSDIATLEERLIAFVTDTFLFGQRGDLDPDTMLLDKGIVDSTGVLELVVFVEEDCNFKVADADLVPENFGSVRRLVDYVKRRHLEKGIDG